MKKFKMGMIVVKETFNYSWYDIVSLNYSTGMLFNTSFVTDIFI